MQATLKTMPAHALAVTIEPLSASDLVAIARCIVIDAEAFPYPSTPFGLRSGSTRVWIARSRERDGVVGFVASAPNGADLDVQGLAVARDHRRQGIGRALIRAVVDQARDQTLRAVSLHVWVGNEAAVQMYREEGFAVRRRLPGYYRADTFDHAGDAFEMARVLER